MTPKEKAKELVDKYLKNNPIQASVGLLKLQAKKCALVAVNEIISICPYQNYKKTISPYDGAELSADYWEEVKTEIEEL